MLSVSKCSTIISCCFFCFPLFRALTHWRRCCSQCSSYWQCTTKVTCALCPLCQWPNNAACRLLDSSHRSSAISCSPWPSHFTLAFLIHLSLSFLASISVSVNHLPLSSPSHPVKCPFSHCEPPPFCSWRDTSNQSIKKTTSTAYITHTGAHCIISISESERKKVIVALR